MNRIGLSRIEVALCIGLMCCAQSASADQKDGSWGIEMHKWALDSQANPNCKVRYVTGWYRPDLSNEPIWGMMTQKQYEWFSTEGMRQAPSVCPVTRDTANNAKYKILLSVAPMAIVTQTTHGSETRTVNEPFHASVNSSATVYSSDGTTATGYGSSTINGNQTRTIIIPTETTITRNSVQLYMFTYRVKEDDVVLIATDKVLYQRVSAAGSGNNAAGAEIGAGIGNIIRASHDAHRADKLYREALDAIIADQISSPSAPPERVQAPVQPSTLIARPISANDISKLRFTSLPENAEIVIDGAFAGNAPSTITLAPGKHSIAVSAKGYQTWSRDMNVVSGSEISIRAVLDKAPNLLRFRE